jgi:hypothetical protein
MIMTTGRAQHETIVNKLDIDAPFAIRDARGDVQLQASRPNAANPPSGWQRLQFVNQAAI